MQQTFNSLFPEFPGNSRIWVYSADRAFSGTELSFVKENVTAFIDDWAAHGKGLKATGDVLFDRFIVIAIDERLVPASGCSIDSSARFIKDLGAELKLDFFNRLKQYIVVENEIKRIHISELGNYPESNLFNPILTDLADFRNNWLVPTKESSLYRQLI